MVIVFLGVTEMEIAEVLLATLGLIFVLIVKKFSQIPLNTFFFFFDLLIPKLKTISIGFFYRLPNANSFLETFFNDVKH